MSLLLSKKNLIIFALIFTCVLITFHYGIYSLHRGDGWFVLNERQIIGDDFKFFWNFLSYDRTSLSQNQVARFLYRPVRMAVSAFTTLFFSENYLLLGLINFFFHSIAVFAFFLLIREFAPLWLSALAALSFAVQYSGLEMVVWNNINIYTLAVSFFTLGIYFFVKEKIFPSALCFLISSLIHEIAILVLPVWAFLYLFSNRKEKLKSVWSAVFLGIVVLNISINGLDFIYRNRHSYRSVSWMSNPAIPLSTIFDAYLHGLNGIFGLQFAIPLITRFDPEIFIMQKASFIKQVIPNGLLYTVSFFLLCFLIQTFANAYFGIREKSDLKRQYVRIFFALFYCMLLVGLLVGRTWRQGLAYVRYNTYYAYFTNYALLSLVILWYSENKETTSRLIRIFFRPAILLLLIFNTVVSYILIQQHLLSRFPMEKKISETISVISQAIKTQPGYCYGGSFSKKLEPYLPPLFLYDESCYKQAGNPVYVEELASGKFVLSTLSEKPFAEGKDSTFSKVHFDTIPKQFLHTKIYWSSHPVSSDHIRLEWEDIFKGSFIVRQRSEGDFIALDSDGHNLFVRKITGINQGHSFNVGRFPLGPNLHEISLRKVGDFYYVFQKNNALVLLKDIDSLEGKIGLTPEEGAPFPKVYTLSENLFTLPLLELPLSDPGPPTLPLVLKNGL